MHAIHGSKKPKNVENHVLKNKKNSHKKSNKKVLDYYAFVVDFPNSVSQIILLSEGTRCLKIKYFYNLINFDVNIPHQTAHS